MRPYAGCEAWFVIRPRELRQSDVPQPMLASPNCVVNPRSRAAPSTGCARRPVAPRCHHPPARVRFQKCATCTPYRSARYSTIVVVSFVWRRSPTR